MQLSPLGPAYAADPLVPLYLLTALFVAGMSAGVVLFERFGGSSRQYFQLSVIMAAWVAALGITNGTATAAAEELWLRIAYVFIPLTPAATYRLSREMIGEDIGPPVWLAWAVGGVFAVINVVSPWLVRGLQSLFVDGTLAAGGWLGALFVAFEFSGVIGAVVLVAWSRRDAETGEARLERAGLVAAGMIGSLPLLDYFLARDPFRAGWLTALSILVGGTVAAVVAIRYRVFAPARSFGTDEVLRTMADAVLVCDPVGRIRSANPAAVALLDRSASQLRNRQLGEVVGWARDDDWKPFTSLDQPATEELDLRRADGEPVRVSASIEPIRLGSQAAGAVIVARDIRKRLETQRALEASQRRYASLFWHNPALLYEFDPEGRFVAANPTTAELLGAAASELRGRPFAEVIAPEEQPVAEEIFRAVLEGESREYEVTVRTARGERRKLRGVSIPIFEGSEVIGVFGVALDVTEENRIRHELEVQRRYFADLFNSSPEGIVLVEPGTDHVLRVNDEFTRMFGYTAEEALGRELTELIVPDERIEEGPALNRQAQEEGRARSETVRQRKDGSLVEVSVLARELRIPGEPRQLYGVYRDISARKEAERALQQREEELRHAQRLEAVGKLAGGVAHDFNNLLTVINGHARFALENTREDCRARDELEEIERAGARAASLTQQLLAYSRRQVLHPKVLDPNAVIRDTEGMLRRLIGEHIRIETRYTDAPARVRADRGQLEQVLVNLVVNARDAIDEGGEITLETGVLEIGSGDARVERWGVEPGEYVRIRVADTGRGMDAETLDHAFDPFFTTKEQGKGTGLGLATVFGIVKQSDGHVVARSEPGAGTTVDVILPRCHEDVAIEAPEAVESVRDCPAGTILVVEDEAAVRKLAVKALEKEGCTVLAAENGIEALALVDRLEGSLDLVVTDLVMPDMGGRELADELRRRRPALPVLFMSGYDDAMVDDADAANHFLAKPFTPRALAARVAASLAS